MLVTERLVLRPPHDDDLPELVELANNRRHRRDAGADAASLRRGRGQGVPDDDAAEAATDTVYAISLADSGAFIGCAGLNPAELGLELGYWVGAPYWGRGYATEAAHALVDLAFRATNVEALHVSCRVINPASRRVIHKCGFQYAGQGMVRSLAAGQMAVERYRLDRKTWVSLRTWARG